MIEKNDLNKIMKDELPNKPGRRKKLPPQITIVKSAEISLKENTIDTFKDFMDLITQLTNTGFSFFRGDKNRNNYSLSPKVYNSKFRGFLAHLDEAIEEFSALTLGRNPIISDGFLEDMINAQHYELPTRLLDWTESALIALYFAVNQNIEKDECDSIVWALNPIALNSKTSFLNKYGYVPIFPSKQDKGLVGELETYYKYTANDAKNTQ